MQAGHIVSIGLAIFAMLFGAGNVVFPLGLGRDVADNVFFAIIGLGLTGIAVPLLGLVSASLFNGSYKKFFANTGKIPGALIAFTCMLLIGPFGATPRCITIAYAAVKWHIQSLPLWLFSTLIAILIYASTVRKRYVVEVFGRFLAPIKLVLLLSIIIIGFMSASTPAASTITAWQSFFKGLQEGYKTLDLLGTIFFSGLIITAIKAKQDPHNPFTSRQIAVIGLKAGIIGGLLLGIVYTGFCLLAAKYSAQIAFVEKEQLLSALATIALGRYASIIANATMAIACLTTAIALSAVFADYLTYELLGGWLAYRYSLLITVGMTFVMTNIGFSGIDHLIEPIIVFCYPALIVLSIANIAYSLWSFSYTKHVVFATILITGIVRLLG